MPLCDFAPPHFAVAGLCFAKPFYATAKRQLPRTLNAIPADGYISMICERMEYEIYSKVLMFKRFVHNSGFLFRSFNIVGGDVKY